MTGRAGRRGLDSVGHAVVVVDAAGVDADVAALATSPAPDLRSSFRPTYNLAVNLVRRYPAEQAHFILDRSFAQFLDSRHHHALSRRLDRALELLERRGHVDLAAWRLTARGAGWPASTTSRDLLVAEALADGLFDGLDPPDLAARGLGVHLRGRAAGRWHRVPPAQGACAPSCDVLAGWREALRDDEEDAPACPAPACPTTGFADVAWRLGARASASTTCLERAELAPGDFVRNVKQLVDLLRQLAMVAPRPGARRRPLHAGRGGIALRGAWWPPRCRAVAPTGPAGGIGRASGEVAAEEPRTAGAVDGVSGQAGAGPPPRPGAGP